MIRSRSRHVRSSAGTRLWMIALSAGVLSASRDPCAQTADPLAPEAAYVVLLRLRWDLYARWKETGQWPNDSVANAALAGHTRYWEAQRQAGRGILAGGMKGEFWDNAAMIIFRARTGAEADSIVRQDPAVRAHVLQSQVRGFDVHWTGRGTPEP